MTQVVQSGTAATEQPAIARKRVDLSYNAAGDWNSIIRSTGAAGSETEAATATYSYFANGGLKQIGYSHSGQPLLNPTAGAPLSSYAWNYDAAGRVTDFTGSSKSPTGAAISDGTTVYTYYDDNELKSAIVNGSVNNLRSESFIYDATGNRKSHTVGTGTQEHDQDRLISAKSKIQLAFSDEVLACLRHYRFQKCSARTLVRLQRE